MSALLTSELGLLLIVLALVIFLHNFLHVLENLCRTVCAATLSLDLLYFGTFLTLLFPHLFHVAFGFFDLEPFGKLQALSSHSLFLMNRFVVC